MLNSTQRNDNIEKKQTSHLHQKLTANTYDS